MSYTAISSKITIKPMQTKCFITVSRWLADVSHTHPGIHRPPHETTPLYHNFTAWRLRNSAESAYRGIGFCTPGKPNDWCQPARKSFARISVPEATPSPVAVSTAAPFSVLGKSESPFTTKPTYAVGTTQCAKKSSRMPSSAAGHPFRTCAEMLSLRPWNSVTMSLIHFHAFKTLQAAKART